MIVLLTRQRDVPREPGHDRLPGKLLEKRYPAAADRILTRYKTYNDQIALAEKYEKEGKALIIAPTDLHGLDTLKKTRQGLLDMYQDGLQQVDKIKEFLSH